MGHKTLTVSEEAYEALARLKKERGTLFGFVRSLEPDEEFAEELETVSRRRCASWLGSRGTAW